MMPSRNSGGALPLRLARLTGSDGEGCVARFEGTAGQLRRGRAFGSALRRHRALADANRLLAVALLKRRGELCACEIQAATGLTHATVSHHMGLLEAAGLVTGRRRGKWMYYRLRDAVAGAIP
jgi:Bacterial regulatory protein, arsR family